jgi:hypothetical protein
LFTPAQQAALERHQVGEWCKARTTLPLARPSKTVLRRPPLKQRRSGGYSRGAATVHDCGSKSRYCVHSFGRQPHELCVLSVEQLDFVINAVDSLSVGLCVRHRRLGSHTGRESRCSFLDRSTRSDHCHLAPGPVTREPARTTRDAETGDDRAGLRTPRDVQPICEYAIEHRVHGRSRPSALPLLKS